MDIMFTVIGLKVIGSFSLNLLYHALLLSCRDNLYQVELEPSTSTELRYQRVRKRDRLRWGRALRGELESKMDLAGRRDLSDAEGHTPLTTLFF